jgi:GLPGLI family protein
MKKIFVFTVLIFGFVAHAQISSNRFFYELTVKPKKDSTKLEKVMTVLDITDKKSIYQDYTLLAQDSIIKLKVEEMQKTKVYKDMSKDIVMPKFSSKVTKTYPGMEVQYSEPIINGMSPIQIAYKENPQFNWKISNEKQKIGEYNTQKATTDFGGRKWNAWFSNDITLQDGPYKFHGLPGLIVKIEDADKNYSWELKGNKKVSDYQEISYAEKVRPGGLGNIVDVSREKFEKTFSDYKKDPFASIRSQIPAAYMSQKMPGSDKTIGDMLKDQEKMMKDFYNSNDNPIELTSLKDEVKKKK